MIKTTEQERPLKVLVTDGNNRAALAITRSLGKSGYHVFVAGESKMTLAGSSRYCIRSFSYSDPNKRPDQFRSEIIRLVRQNKIDILMPAAEMTTLECMKIKDTIKDQCTVPFHSYESVNSAASKYEVLKLAQTLDIPIPVTYYLHTPAALENALRCCDKSGYPIVIKASRSRVALLRCTSNSSTQYAYNASDLKRIVLGFEEAQYPLLIQERVQGDGVGIFTCFNQGEAIAYFSHRRIREKPPSGGVSVLRESFPIDPRLRDYSRRLLEALKWHGVGMVEFKKDNASGDYRLMEINGRFWGSLQLAIDAGVDFPLLLARIAVGQHVEPILHYDLNVRTRWLCGDIDALLAILFKPADQLHLPDNFPSKKKYLREFFRVRKNDLNFEVLKLSDPKPWLLEAMRWLHLV